MPSSRRRLSRTACRSSPGMPATIGCSRASMTFRSSPKRPGSSGAQKEDAKVHDVRPGRAGHDQVAGLLEEAVGIVVLEVLERNEAEGPGRLDRPGIGPSAGRVGRAVDAVGPEAEDEP